MKLRDAARNGNIDILNAQIISGGCDLNERDSKGRTILHIAAKYGQAEFIRALDKHLLPADLTKTDDDGDTAVTLAITYDRVEAINALHDLKVDLNARDSHGDTPAIHAAYFGSVEMIEALHARGADLSVESNRWPINTPAGIAAEYGHIDFIHALFRLKVPLDPARSTHDSTPLCLAIKHKHLKVAEALITYGADLNKRGAYEWPPFIWAIESGSLEILELLINKGADKNQLGRYQLSALHHAAHAGAINIIEYLLKLGFDINNITNTEQLSPLHIALLNKPNLQLITFLLDQGADINAASTNGLTPLHYAVQKGAGTKIINLLLNRGANLNSSYTRNGMQCSVIHTAIIHRNAEAIPLLIRHGANIENLTFSDIGLLFFYAEDNADIEMMRLLLKCWPTFSINENNRENKIAHIVSTPFILEIQQQLANEQTSLKLIDQSWRHDPHSFFGFLPRDVGKYIIRPMVEDSSVAHSSNPADYSSSDDEDVYYMRINSIPAYLM